MRIIQRVAYLDFIVKINKYISNWNLNISTCTYSNFYYVELQFYLNVFLKKKKKQVKTWIVKCVIIDSIEIDECKKSIIM